ncbi:hypothetical protein IWW50_005993 [Coemansia erecta]|nr:hypothetical protein GGF43_004521 [Coemansia sp. RSA 2618]KAJ2817935.1 hypothetical protein IWW50_005993 [Coemansia erecta]
MSSPAVLCTHFDTPEGRWALVSEFTSEDAVNQFVPHISAQLGGDDLSMGASGADTSPVVPTPPVPSSSSSAPKFGASSTIMASAGIMFGGSDNSNSTGTPASAGTASKPNTHVLANRPTRVAILRSPVAANAVGERAGDERAGRSAAHGRGLVTKSTSSFVSRIITNENLARWIVDAQTVYVLFNAPKSLGVVGVQADNFGETLARLDLAASTPVCFDANRATRSGSRLDVVLGFVQGNIVWYDAISGKYARLNKNSGYKAAIVCIRWLPGSDSLFMVGMADGAVMVMDRTKEDFSVPSIAARAVTALDTFETAAPLKPKSNPVSYWKVGARAITSIEFSPDAQRVAVTSEDGALRVIDYLNEELEDVYLSYFGALTCCAWSNDGKYVVAGGKDDLITVWSYDEQTVVARCQGHASWVRGIVFDPGHESEHTHRFFSVGDDARLLVWDLSLAALHRPRALAHRTATGASSAGPAAPSRSFAEPPHKPAVGYEGHAGIVHARMPKGSVAVLQPLMAETIHEAPICSLELSQDLLVTACRRGVIKMWKRPRTADLSAYLPG